MHAIRLPRPRILLLLAILAVAAVLTAWLTTRGAHLGALYYRGPAPRFHQLADGSLYYRG